MMSEKNEKRVFAAAAGRLSLVAFAAFAGAASAAVVTVPDAPFGKLEITVPEFPARDFPITDFGAQEGVKATDAFAQAMRACEAAGGGRVVVPKGDWLTGAVRFGNNCDLHLADGATLAFTDDPATPTA